MTFCGTDLSLTYSPASSVLMCDNHCRETVEMMIQTNSEHTVDRRLDYRK